LTTARPAVGGECDPAGADDEVFWTDLAVVDQGDDRVGDPRAELVGQVEGERRAAEVGSVVGVEIRVEPAGEGSDGEILDQQGTDVREQAVDRIAERAVIAAVPVKWAAGQLRSSRSMTGKTAK
jgi:hypothetical protein